jgi:hypothetical protein
MASTVEKKNPNAVAVAASPLVLTAINDRVNAEESANHGVFTFSVDATSETLTSAQFWTGHTIRLTEGSPAPGAAVTLTVPGGSPPEERGDFILDNQMTEDCSVTVSGQSGAVPLVPAGKAVHLKCDGSDVDFADDYSVNSSDVRWMVEISQTAYDALSPPDADTFYMITS